VHTDGQERYRCRKSKSSPIDTGSISRRWTIAGSYGESVALHDFLQRYGTRRETLYTWSTPAVIGLNAGGIKSLIKPCRGCNERLTVFGLETEEFPDVICRDVDHRVIDTAHQKSKEIVGTAAAWEDAISLMKRVSTKPSCVWNTETVISFNCPLKVDIK
jgi:hypothetical protein